MSLSKSIHAVLVCLSAAVWMLTVQKITGCGHRQLYQHLQCLCYCSILGLIQRTLHHIPWSPWPLFLDETSVCVQLRWLYCLMLRLERYVLVITALMSLTSDSRGQHSWSAVHGSTWSWEVSVILPTSLYFVLHAWSEGEILHAHAHVPFPGLILC